MAVGKSPTLRYDITDKFDPRVQGQPAKKGTIFRYIPAVGDPVILIKASSSDTDWIEVGNSTGYVFAESFTFGAPAATSGVLAIPNFKFLQIVIGIAGFDVADIPALRFNQDAGNNYWSRISVTDSLNDTKVNLAGGNLTTGRIIVVDVMNIAALSKSVTGQLQLLSGNPGAVANTANVGGEWVNAVDPIDEIELLAVGGNNFLAGSTITILGLE